MPERLVKIYNPAWVDGLIDWSRTYQTDADKMGLTIGLSRKNVEQQTGEPFGAAIFRCDSGQLIAVGVSQVVRKYNSVQHAEMTAIMLAEQRLHTYNLRVHGTPYELFSSCDPCAMCLGATHWSGVRRLVCGAGRDAAQGIGFDEGPVFPESYQYLEERGVEVVRGVRNVEAAEIITTYFSGGGLIHNRQS